MILGIRVPALAGGPAPALDARPGVWRELVVGLRFVGRSRVLMAVLVSGCGAVFGANAINVLDVFFVSGNLPVALVVMFAVGVPLAALNSIAGPIILKVTPRELLGRVISVLNPALQLAGILSIAIASYLASTVLRGLDARIAGVHFGRIDTIFFAGGVMIVASAVYAYVALRGMDAPRQPTPEPQQAEEPVLPVT